MFFCAAAGYAFARLEFPGRNIIFIAFLSVLMVPSQLFLSRSSRSCSASAC